MPARRALVLGLGRFGGGLASVRHLRKLGYRVRICDRATADELRDAVLALAEEPELEWRLGESGEDPGLLSGVDLLVCNPGVPNEHPLLACARRSRIPITQEVVLFLDAYPGRVVVVTARGGKDAQAAAVQPAVVAYPALFDCDTPYSVICLLSEWHVE